MESTKSLDPKQKQTGMTLIGGVLALVGIANFGNSIVGALALLVAALFIVPKTRGILSSKVPAPVNRPLVGKILVTLLTVAGFGIIGSAIQDADREIFLKDKSEITQNIRSKIAASDLSAAKDLVEKYLRAVPTDPDLKVLKEEVVAAKKKADEVAEAEARSRTAAEEKRQDTNGPLAGDSDLIGKCIGFIGMEIQTAGSPQAIHPSFQQYLSSHGDYAQRIVQLAQRYPNCTSGGTDLSSCLQSEGVSDWDIKLMLSYNTGITIFKTQRAIGSAACMG